MKAFFIKIAKKNRILYAIAKKCYRSVKPAKKTEYRNRLFYLGYELNAEEQIPIILKHYAQLENNSTRLVILVHGHVLDIHRYVREHPDVIFLSMDYYERYHKKLCLYNLVLIDPNQPVSSVLTYLC